MFVPLHSSRCAGLLLFLLFAIAGEAQTGSSPDTAAIPQGIVSVRRAPVPAAYEVRVQYFFPDKPSRRSRVSKFNRKEIVLSDSGSASLPPVPIDMRPEQANLSNRQLYKYLQQHYPAQPYNWPVFFSNLGYQFAWSDSVRRDSARIEISIDRNGVASYKALPWSKNADSASVALQENTLNKLRTKPFWYAGRFFSRRGKYRPTACVVILTIYAFDPNAGRLMPVNVIRK